MCCEYLFIWIQQSWSGSPHFCILEFHGVHCQCQTTLISKRVVPQQAWTLENKYVVLFYTQSRDSAVYVANIHGYRITFIENSYERERDGGGKCSCSEGGEIKFVPWKFARECSQWRRTLTEVTRWRGTREAVLLTYAYVTQVLRLSCKSSDV